MSEEDLVHVASVTGTESRAMSSKGPSRHSVKEVKSLLSNEKWKVRCTIFPWLDYVAGVAVTRQEIALDYNVFS